MVILSVTGVGRSFLRARLRRSAGEEEPVRHCVDVNGGRDKRRLMRAEDKVITRDYDAEIAFHQQS
jgi:hypothetical protein